MIVLVADIVRLIGLNGDGHGRVLEGDGRGELRLRSNTNSIFSSSSIY
jgi:hypothetical protein